MLFIVLLSKVLQCRKYYITFYHGET